MTQSDHATVMPWTQPRKAGILLRYLQRREAIAGYVCSALASGLYRPPLGPMAAVC